MMNNYLSLADLHCDTPWLMCKNSLSFDDSSLSVSYPFISNYSRYIQVAAVWTDKTLSDCGAYRRFYEIVRNFKRKINSYPDCAVYPFDNSEKANKLFVLSIEDARLLEGQLERLDLLYKEGVRFLTPLWRGVSCIGGAFDTDEGLSAFGKEVVKKCARLGIIPDISHASEKSAADIFEAGDSSPIIASHSSSFSVYSHPRNLKDYQFAQIKASGGLVGINLYAEALGLDKNSFGLSAVIKHIEHYLSLGGENTVSFGCDFDGAEIPNDLNNVSSLYRIAEELQKLNYSDELINNLFYENAHGFIMKYIIK